MKNKEIEEILNYMKQYVENKYEHDSEPMLNWKDLQIVLSYIEQLKKDYFNELEENYKQSKWLVKKQKKIEQLENKYNKALETLIGYNMPCEFDDFNLLDTDYCETSCGVDDEQYKKCWDRWIERRIANE